MSKCPVDCKTAKTSVNDCECSCKGDNHGTQSAFYDGMQNPVKPIHKGMGGEIKQFIEKVETKKIKCQGTCFTQTEDGRNPRIPITGFVGYEHDGGLEDAAGKGWWVFVECPKCEYQHSFNTIESNIDFNDKDGDME